MRHSAHCSLLYLCYFPRLSLATLFIFFTNITIYECFKIISVAWNPILGMSWIIAPDSIRLTYFFQIKNRYNLAPVSIFTYTRYKVSINFKFSEVVKSVATTIISSTSCLKNITETNRLRSLLINNLIFAACH